MYTLYRHVAAKDACKFPRLPTALIVTRIKNVPPNASILFVRYSVMEKKPFDDINPKYLRSQCILDEVRRGRDALALSKFKFQQDAVMKRPRLAGTLSNLGFDLVVTPQGKTSVGSSTLFSSFIYAYFFIIINDFKCCWHMQRKQGQLQVETQDKERKKLAAVASLEQKKLPIVPQPYRLNPLIYAAIIQNEYTIFMWTSKQLQEMLKYFTEP